MEPEDYLQPGVDEQVTGLDILRPAPRTVVRLCRTALAQLDTRHLTVGEIEDFVNDKFPGWLPHRFYTAN